jgi:hypothetical protein
VDTLRAFRVIDDFTMSAALVQEWPNWLPTARCRYDRGVRSTAASEAAAVVAASTGGCVPSPCRVTPGGNLELAAVWSPPTGSPSRSHRIWLVRRRSTGCGRHKLDREGVLSLGIPLLVAVAVSHTRWLGSHLIHVRWAMDSATRQMAAVSAFSQGATAGIISDS